ncbi:hypothetical protein L1987_19937 [Smallanthus sonchifolius]|uniref:Uncharacterized protein n=1 Tax=Smallanthus sonchifolius TaxID=185202 RepID=A0ACB9IS57_9ASTR|nr:hypothetical protein L1987_19937 [Smallanthus sonchifolius]
MRSQPVKEEVDLLSNKGTKRKPSVVAFESDCSEGIQGLSNKRPCLIVRVGFAADLASNDQTRFVIAVDRKI